jgi:hypothetical protein
MSYGEASWSPSAPTESSPGSWPGDAEAIQIIQQEDASAANVRVRASSYSLVVNHFVRINAILPIFVVWSEHLQATRVGVERVHRHQITRQRQLALVDLARTAW